MENKAFDWPAKKASIRNWEATQKRPLLERFKSVKMEKYLFQIMATNRSEYFQIIMARPDKFKHPKIYPQLLGITPTLMRNYLMMGNT